MTKSTKAVVNNEVIEASVTALMCQVTSLREQRMGSLAHLQQPTMVFTTY